MNPRLNIFLPTNVFEKQRQLCVNKLTLVYREMEPKNWNPNTSKTEIVRLYNQFYELYLDLYNDRLVNMCPYGTFYRVYPKFHLLCHVIEQGLGTPRDEWCYIDEDEIGDCARAAEVLHASSLQRSLIDRYRVVDS